MSAGSTGQAEGPDPDPARERPPQRILVGWDRYGDETWWGPEYILNGEQPVYVPEARLKEAEAQRDAAQARIVELEAEVAGAREAALREAIAVCRAQAKRWDEAAERALTSETIRTFNVLAEASEQSADTIAALLPQPKEPSP